MNQHMAYAASFIDGLKEAVWETSYPVGHHVLLKTAHKIDDFLLKILEYRTY
jgi:hypothetical protein